jgi:transcriptional regulator with XRE-family HTH domain
VPQQKPDRFVRFVTQRIAAVRRARGMSQEEAAERYGTALKNWQRIESGQNVTLSTLARVSAALGVTPGELVRSRAATELLVADVARGSHWKGPKSQRAAPARKMNRSRRS